MQFLFAGKSHPADQPGKDIVAGVVKLAREEPCVAFLKDYDLALARHLVHGADVWLNNPLRFLEATVEGRLAGTAGNAGSHRLRDEWGPHADLGGARDR